MENLTEKQKLFVLYYLIHLNATKAAKLAGYEGNDNTLKSIGSENLTKPDIAKAINEAMDQRAAEIKIEAKDVIKIVIDTIERCQQVRPVTDKFGVPILVEVPGGTVAPAYEFEPHAVLKGAELLGKHIKMWTDKVQHGGDKDNPILVKNPTAEEIRDLIITARGQPSGGNGQG